MGKIRPTARCRAVSVVAILFCASASLDEVCRADESPSKADAEKEEAKESTNPIARKVQILVKSYFNGGIEPNHRVQYIGKLVPHIPIELTHVFAIVTRWILPITEQPITDKPSGSIWGIGDFNPQIYLGAMLAKDLRAAIGTTWILPTATDSKLGAGKLSVGPAGALIWSPSVISTGVIVNNAFSVAGDPSRSDVSSFTLQPWLHVFLPEGMYLTTYPEMSADWKKKTWTVPIGGGVGRVMTIGARVNVSFEAYWNALTPPGGSTWQIKIPVTFLFPQKPH